MKKILFTLFFVGFTALPSIGYSQSFVPYQTSFSEFLPSLVDSDPYFFDYLFQVIAEFREPVYINGGPEDGPYAFVLARREMFLDYEIVGIKPVSDTQAKLFLAVEIEDSGAQHFGILEITLQQKNARTAYFSVYDAAFQYSNQSEMKPCSNCSYE